MNVLAVDTSHSRGSASVSTGARCETVRLDSASSHLTELAKALAALLSAAGVTVADIDRVAIVTGPGSFTGLRVGMAYVKGLYAARAMDVVAMTSLELLALQVGEGIRAVSPMIDARKDEVYAAFYETAPGGGDLAGGESGEPLARGLVERVAPWVVSPHRHIESIGRCETVFVGSGALRYRAQIEEAFGKAARFASEDLNLPDTGFLCRLAERLAPISAGDVVTLEPFYIRPEDVRLKPLKRVSAYDRS
jgi:tRNA threonylcarbamoyladenosine biosynthesis protein TsaB